MSRIKILTTTFLAAAAFASSGPAAVLNYTISGEGSGSLNGSNFWYTTVSISATFDTSQIINLGNGAFVLPWTRGAALNITGVGAGYFDTPTQIFAVPQGATVGISGIDRAGDVHDIAYLGTGVTGYDLSTPVQPSRISYNFVAMSGPYATSAGDFTIGSWFPAFYATAVPEPGTTALCGLGGIALWFRYLTKRKQRSGG